MARTTHTRNQPRLIAIDDLPLFSSAPALAIDDAPFELTKLPEKAPQPSLFAEAEALAYHLERETGAAHYTRRDPETGKPYVIDEFGHLPEARYFRRQTVTRRTLAAGPGAPTGTMETLGCGHTIFYANVGVGYLRLPSDRICPECART